MTCYFIDIYFVGGFFSFIQKEVPCGLFSFFMWKEGPWLTLFSFRVGLRRKGWQLGGSIVGAMSLGFDQIHYPKSRLSRYGDVGLVFLPFSCVLEKWELLHTVVRCKQSNLCKHLAQGLEHSEHTCKGGNMFISPELNTSLEESLNERTGD